MTMTTGIGWEHEIDGPTLAWLDAHVVDITSVIMRTERDATGVKYTVLVLDGEHDAIPYDDCAWCAGEREIWSRTVEFGGTRANRVGGSQFIAAVLDQEDCAGTMWRRSRDAVRS